jgi:hypothetical protein
MDALRRRKMEGFRRRRMEGHRRRRMETSEGRGWKDSEGGGWKDSEGGGWKPSEGGGWKDSEGGGSCCLRETRGAGRKEEDRSPFCQVIGWMDRRCILLHRCGIGLDSIAPVRHWTGWARLSSASSGAGGGNPFGIHGENYKNMCLAVYSIAPCILLHQSRAHPVQCVIGLDSIEPVRHRTGWARLSSASLMDTSHTTALEAEFRF